MAATRYLTWAFLVFAPVFLGAAFLESDDDYGGMLHHIIKRQTAGNEWRPGYPNATPPNCTTVNGGQANPNDSRSVYVGRCKVNGTFWPCPIFYYGKANTQTACAVVVQNDTLVAKKVLSNEPIEWYCPDSGTSGMITVANFTSVPEAATAFGTTFGCLCYNFYMSHNPPLFGTLWKGDCYSCNNTKPENKIYNCGSITSRRSDVVLGKFRCP